MKRRRGNVNPKPTKSAVFSSNEAVSNGRFLKPNDRTGLVDLVHDKFDSRRETETPRADSSMSGWQEDPNSLRQMVKSIIKDLAKGMTAEPSRGFSSTYSPTSSGSFLRPQGEGFPQENSRVIHQDPRYKEQELKVALSVIKKIMKLDAAEPFNVPVDPIALGIPDYFDVIDTPMDFGTICNNLENGLKYVNTEDVYKDVLLIWDNCSKYNNKDSHILGLMNRVKINFIKNWTAAGLYMDQSQLIDESSSLRRRKRGKPYPVAPVSGNSARLEQEKGFNQVLGNQLWPIGSRENQPQLSSSQSQPSPHQGDAAHISTPESSILRRSTRGKAYPVAPVSQSRTRLQQEAGFNQVLDNQLLPIGSQQNQPQPSSSQPQPSPRQGDAAAHISTTTPGSKSVQKKRKGRGPTRCLQLLNTKERIAVATNELGQPIGPEAAKLTSFLGLTARDGNFAPLTYPSWRLMPEEYKEKMWQKVLSKFDIDPDCRSWVLMSLGTKWANFRFHLKANHYDIHETDAERLADRDERVQPEQWSFLVSLWSSEKWKNMSATNKANRAKLKFIHASGKKSFARIREEERAKRADGKEPSRSELFILTRTRKNGEPVNEATAAVISQLRTSVAPEGQNLDNGSRPDDEVYTQVMGPEKKGGVFYGLGGSRTHLRFGNPSTSEAIKMAKEANTEVREIKEKVVSMEHTCAQMAAQMAAMMSMMATMQKVSFGQHTPDAIPGTLNAIGGLLNQPESTSMSHRAVPSRQTRGRKKRR